MGLINPDYCCIFRLMPRQPRFEHPGAIYHVLNRGNYRSAIFETDGAKQALLRSLSETAEKMGWRVHAWAIMANHYHAAIRTPKANLVEGMKHWQGTFAVRFNRMRDERGHIFQGRYKSLRVDPVGGLGALCHYIHLNPLRAKVCSLKNLNQWPWNSLSWICNRSDRPSWHDPLPALQHAGMARDNRSSHTRYLRYLGNLMADESARADLQFESMSKGWVVGSDDFKASLVEEHKELKARLASVRTGLRETQEEQWWREVEKMLTTLGYSPEDLKLAGRSADWKVALAAALKTRTTVTNRWMSEHLNLGNLHEVSRKVNAWLRQPDQRLSRKLKVTPNPKA